MNSEQEYYVSLIERLRQMPEGNRMVGIQGK